MAEPDTTRRVKTIILNCLNGQLAEEGNRPGYPAAHEDDDLPLLPSGPGGVWYACIARDLACFDLPQDQLVISRQTSALSLLAVR